MQRHTALALLLAVLLFAFHRSEAQCTPNVPNFVVNLTGNPDSSWISPAVVRDGDCCGSSSPDRCISFVVTLDPGAVGIIFDIYSGAVPPGALYYQIGCGPLHQVGEAICLNGPGPHLLTFCKPGNNLNEYLIKSVKGPAASDDLDLYYACNGMLYVSGYRDTTIHWNSISPGGYGTFNNILSCTQGCDTAYINYNPLLPPNIYYQVCGTPTAVCGLYNVCDTVRVSFYPNLYTNIQPHNPILCYQDSTVQLTANVNNGNPPLQYLWSTGDTTTTITVGPGTYSVHVIDQKSCSYANDTVVVTKVAQPVRAFLQADFDTCITTPSVNLTGSVTGASSMIWGGGTTSFLPANTASTVTYNFTTADQATGYVDITLHPLQAGTNCPFQDDTIRVTLTTFSSTVTNNTTPVTCYGFNNGSIQVSATGGYGPFLYQWSTGWGLPSMQNLPQGNYALTVTDNNKCTATYNYTITQPPLLAITSTVTDVACNGGNSGAVLLNTTGGIPAYNYQWSNGNTTANNGNLTAGNYYVTVSDQNFCSTTGSYSVTQPTPLTLNTAGIQNVTCFGNANGTITANPTDGTTPYTFLWSNGATTQTIGNLNAGNYQLTVTDQHLCSVTAAYNITQPSALVTASPNIQNINCYGGNNGSITVNMSGGTFPYSYQWSTGATSQTINNLNAASYSVNVTDANSCSASAIYVITQPPLLSMNPAVVQGADCNNANTGNITLNLSGGTLPYTYVWSNGANTNVNSNLFAGTYTVTVYDQKNCSVTGSYIITQPTALLFSNPAIQNISCFGGNNGTITVTGSGSNPPYNYLWNNGNTSPSNAGLAAGNYAVTVTDQKNCTASAVYSVTQPPLLTLNPASVQNVNCFGGSNGNVTANPIGGTPGYSYVWSTGSTSQNINNLLPGVYSVTVNDQNFCSVSASYIITQPAQFVVNNGTVQNATCYNGNNGSIAITVSGGMAPYTYYWSTAGNTNVVSNLYAGNYGVTVYDQNFCSVTSAYTVLQPTQIVFGTPTIQHVTCYGGNNGSVGITVSGGTAPYFYNWNNGATSATVLSAVAGNYTITVTDQNTCTVTSIYTINQPTPIQLNAVVNNESCFNASNGNIITNPTGGSPGYSYQWNTGATTNNILNLVPGNYAVTVTDQIPCSVSSVFQVNQPALLTISNSSVQNANCYSSATGNINITPTGGTLPYSFQWSNGALTQNALNLYAGNYTVTVFDNNFCSSTASFTVTEPGQMQASIAGAQSVTCYGGMNGSISTATVGGVPPYAYQWSNGANSANVANLSAGNYVVTVIDQNLCTATAFYNMTEPNAIVLSNSNIEHVKCFGEQNGKITLSVTGGTPLYDYLWSTGATVNTIQNLFAGTYMVTVTDQAQCTASAAYAVGEPQPLQVSATAIGVSCHGGDGTVNCNVTGGTSPFDYYLWLNGNLQQVNSSGQFNQLAINTYQVTVIDTNLCKDTTQVIVPPASPDVFEAHVDSILCPEGNNGNIIVSALNVQNAPYTFALNTGQTNNSGVFSSLISGNYSVTITNVQGCDTVMYFNLYEPVPAYLEIIPHLDTLNMGESMQFQFVFGPYPDSTIISYNWEPHEGLSCYDCPNPIPLNYQLENYYRLSVTYGNGCEVNAWAVIYINSTYTIFIPNAFVPDGDGKDDVFRVYGNKAAWKQIDFKIFNRIGEKVYDSKDINFEWDGTYKGVLQNPGVFVYYARLKFLDDHTEEFKGSITLIR